MACGTLSSLSKKEMTQNLRVAHHTRVKQSIFWFSSFKTYAKSAAADGFFFEECMLFSALLLEFEFFHEIP